MPLPRDPVPDATPALLRDGYRFISKRCDELGSNGFRTRIGLKKVTCIRGREAAEAFYHAGRFTRRGAIPPTTVRLLQDLGSVQALDGEDHHHRKELWMRMVAQPGSVESLRRCFTEAWDEWTTDFAGRTVLHEDVRMVLTAAALRWTRLGEHQGRVSERNEEFSAMIDGAGSLGIDQLRGQALRQRSERWAAEVMKKAFEDPGSFPADSVPRLLAEHRGPAGEALTLDEAKVELINSLRPVTAIARFVVFAALTLHERPEWAAKLQDRPDLVQHFAAEVRRLTPFFPAVGGIVREPFDFAGEHFAEGDWVLFDIYGTNRDDGVFAEPEAFDPQRFEDWTPGAYDMAPQGAGPYETTHRCPGEKATVAVLEDAVRKLLELSYTVPEQDLEVDPARLPALPASGFVIAPAAQAH